MAQPHREFIDPRVSYWYFQLYAWGFQTVCLLLFALTTPPFMQWGLALATLVKVLLLAVISHGIVVYAYTRGWFKMSRTQLSLRGIVICLIGSILPTVLFYPVADFFTGQYYKDKTVLFLVEVLVQFVTLIMWGGLFQAYYYYELNKQGELDRIRLSEASKEAQLLALKNQINPHFLFNSFNLLRALVLRDQELARDAITHLSELMRHSLTLASRNTITLTEELQFLGDYLALERLRYEERLRITSEIAKDIGAEKIPAMLLHTLVENAVKHGLDQDCAGVDIHYSVWKYQDKLRLRVTNSGAMRPTEGHTGTGLKNVRDRLHLLYGENASVTITHKENEVLAEAEWPSQNAAITS